MKENNIKNILEVGSAIGYSAIKMALVDNDIKNVVSIKKDSVALYNRISNGAVGVFVNTKEDNPRLSFKLNNVLSACYKVKIVVVPPHLLNSNDTSWVKPNKFLATLTCGNPKLKDATLQFSLGRKDSCEKYQNVIYSNPAEIDTIELVPLMAMAGSMFRPTGADYIEIPVCEFQEESKLNGTLQTKLEIISSLSVDELNSRKTYKDAEGVVALAEQNYLKAKETYVVAEEAYLEERAKLSEEELEKLDNNPNSTDSNYRDFIRARKAYNTAKAAFDTAPR